MRRSRLSDEGGQAVVEILVLTPLLMICGLIAMQALVVGANHVSADSAAHAGALAAQGGGDVEGAARDAVPDWSRGRVSVQERGDRVEVTLRPRSLLPGLAGLLTVRSSARAVRITGLARGREWSHG